MAVWKVRPLIISPSEWRYCRSSGCVGPKEVLLSAGGSSMENLGIGSFGARQELRTAWGPGDTKRWLEKNVSSRNDRNGAHSVLRFLLL